MIKVVHIVSTLRNTAPINVLFNILKHLPKDKFDITIITLSPEVKGKSLLKQFLGIGVKVKQLNLSRLQGYLFGGFKLKKIISKLKPDIIHSHCFRTILFTSLYLSDYKTYATLHCDYDMDYKMNYGSFISSIMSKITDFCLKRLKIIVCVSELLCKIINSKKSFESTFINNGIDITRFKPNNKEFIRNKLNIPLDKTVWIWSGRMTELKRPQTLTSIIEKFNSNNYFIICGDGELKSQLVEDAKSFDNIVFTGNVDNIQEYLQASDYYVSTSTTEGLPLSVLEGLACGLPCILSNILQHQFLFNYGFKIGELFEVNNSEDLYAACIRIQDEDYLKLSDNATTLVKENFNDILMAKKYEELYDNIVKY